MKIAVMSDVHSNYLVFKKAVKDARKKDVELFLFLGDYVTDGFDANKILNIIKKFNAHVIIGNREKSVIKYSMNDNKKFDDYLQFKSMRYGSKVLSKNNLKYLKSLPIYKILEINGKKICMSHGSPYNVRDRLSFQSYKKFDKLIEDYNCDLYLFGHQHKNYFTKYKEKLFINVGSIGLPTNGLPFTYSILDIDKDIKHEKIYINYEYSKLEKYYKNSEYYKKINIWCNLLLLTMKDSGEHVKKFMEYIYKSKNIDKNHPIPDDIFIEAYNEFMAGYEQK